MKVHRTAKCNKLLNEMIYKRYGKIGVSVSNEWLNFSNFYNDIISMNNFNREKFLNDYIAIDKDKKQIDVPMKNRIYSKETVSLLDRKENNIYRDNIIMGEKHSIYFICKYNEIETLERNVAKFARNHSIDIKHIRNILYGITIPKKYDFRYPTNNELEKISSGLLKVGDKIS